MQNENDYLEAVNDMKKQYEEKERELKSEKERTEFFQKELISLYGSIRLLDKSTKQDYLPIETLFLNLELIERRLETVYEMILEQEDIDD